MISTRFTAGPVHGIPTIDGWSLVSDIVASEDDRYVQYFARGPETDEHLHVSRSFTPTPERWSWLVRHEFPGPIRRSGGTLTAWNDVDIDDAIAADGAPCLFCPYPSGCAPQPCKNYPTKDPKA